MRMIELVFLAGIYTLWLVLLVNAMIACDEISLTIATLPFIVTFPIALLLASLAELYMRRTMIIDILLTMIVGVLLFVRWVMAIAGE
ncbi:MAG: hypothetical protein ACTSPX_02120 [Candidatus Thorarchaeota archaeon]